MRIIANMLVLMFLSAISAFGQCKTESCGLVIRGEVAGMEVDHGSKDYVKFNLRLAIEFKNEGNKSIILFKPNTGNTYFEDRYYLGATSLSVSRNGNTIHSEAAWESIMGSPFYALLAENIDTKVPVTAFTKILQPGEVWAFQDQTQIRFSHKKDRMNDDREKTWSELESLDKELWLRVHYELSPWNVEYFKPNLIRTLAKRWKQYGNVLVEPKKDGRFNHFTISSEPISIDFRRATENRVRSEIEK